MYKDGVLTIGDWQKGIGESPYSGFEDIVNCDIHDPAGVLKIALAPTKISASTVTGLIGWMTVNPGVSSVWYAGELRDNQAYSISASSVVTDLSHASAGSLLGGTFWRGYLIVARRSNTTATLDAYNGSWDYGFENLGTVPAAVGRYYPMSTHPSDGVLYIGWENDIASLAEATTFDSTSSGTYTYAASALDLPPGYIAESISQLGSLLEIGASKIGGSMFQSNNFDGLLLPWDRSASSFTLPVTLDRGAVRQQISRNGSIVLANGTTGDFIMTNGSSTVDLPEIGILKKTASSSVGEIYPGARAFVNGEYLFGISSQDTSFTPAGIYGRKNNAWRRLTISTDEVGENGDLNIGAIHSKDDVSFFASWEDSTNSAFGIDEFGKSSYRYTGYRASAISQIFQVGTPNRKKSFRMCEVVLAQSLATDQAVRVSYRKDNMGDFTTIKTIDFDTYGATLGEAFEATIQDAVMVQIKVELTTGTNSTTTPALKEIRFW